MKQFLARVTALTISGAVCVVAAFFCSFYYLRYKAAITDLEYRVNGFDMRLATLESHKSRELTPVHAWGIISTADHAEDEGLCFYQSSAVHPYVVLSAKGGPVICPELRLVAGSNAACQYNIQTEEFARVVDAWLSLVEPYDQLASFEEFRVNCSNGTNIVRLIARPRRDASIKMGFELVLLCLK